MAAESSSSAAAGHPAERQVFLSMLPAGDRERRQAVIVFIVSAASFAAALPFARWQLPAVGAFIPIYESALVINDLVTAILLFAQFAILRSRALPLLACGYLFTALIAVAHLMTFPGLFTPGGLLGAGPQSTAWLYMFWHAGFPLIVIAYAWRKDREPLPRSRRRVRRTMIGAIAAVLAAVVLLAAWATAGQDLLPAIMQGNRYTPAMIVVVGSVWLASFAALAVLWRRRPHSVLDLWLMVVMSAWIFDVALSAVFNGGRFDLGFYAGRIYGLSAASFVLLVLLLETGALYARLARAYEIERRERERRLREVQSELVHLSRVNELGRMVTALAHEVSQPLDAVSSYLRASDQMVQMGDPKVVQASLEKAAKQAMRAKEIIQRLRNLVRNSGAIKQQPESLGATIEEVASLALLGAAGKNVRLEVRVHPRAASALIDKMQIQQVLLSLINNAIEAMADSARRTLVVTTALSGEDMIEVALADNGRGLADAVRDKLFQPFVTTKPTGIGIGLSICRSIVEAHGGRIWATDNPAGGAVFRFSVPRGTEEQSDLPGYVRELLAPPPKVMTFESA
jgi:signal transduction histidine kinase